MSAQEGVYPKRCPNKFCKQTDITDFSTCRYCGARYDGQQLRPVEKVSTLESILANPRLMVSVVIGVLSLISSLYLSSVLGAPSGSYASRRGGIPSIPGAFIYYFGSKMASNAERNVNNQSEILKNDPSNYGALISRADAHYTRLEMEQAMKDYSAAIAVAPGRREGYEKRAIIYDAMGNYKLSEQDRQVASSCKE
jgi:tetratricopeptide (TPR) repeat protein